MGFNLFFMFLVLLCHIHLCFHKLIASKSSFAVAETYFYENKNRLKAVKPLAMFTQIFSQSSAIIMF